MPDSARRPSGRAPRESFTVLPGHVGEPERQGGRLSSLTVPQHAEADPNPTLLPRRVWTRPLCAGTRVDTGTRRKGWGVMAEHEIRIALVLNGGVSLAVWM